MVNIDSDVAMLVFIGVCYQLFRWFTTGQDGFNSEWYK